MPNVEPVAARGDRYQLRHVGPLSSVWPTSPNAPVAVLARTDMVSRPLPMSQLPSSPDFVSGTWNGRLGDAGDGTLVFPNGPAGDGIPYRTRFDATGHLQWVEILDNGEIDFVGVIDKVTVDQQKVTVHLSDGWLLLKKAYVRDWVVTQAPRDVIERGTQVWVPTVADNFPAGSLNSQWSASTAGGAGNSIAIGPSGGLILSASGASGSVSVQSNVGVPSGTQVWASQCLVQSNTLAGGGVFRFEVTESVDVYLAEVASGDPIGVQLSVNGTQMAFREIPVATSYSLALESDGEWVWMFVNGQLIGCVRRGHTSTTALLTTLWLTAATGVSTTVTVGNASTRALQPFLMRGSDKGDYVLPGDATTFPNGGLHARYFNDLDLQSDANRLVKILSPPRRQAYAGSGTNEYANQQDTQLTGQQNPTPGAATTNWSCIWFGAIYLKLSAGNYTLGITTTTGTFAGAAVRLWIGQTQFGSQLLDQWNFTTNVNYTFTVNAATLGGRDGWYPIRVEWAVDTGGWTDAPFLTLRNSPTSYTDPGGTAIGAGAQNITFPGSSLSPLGCVDQRYQGVSHFDLVQQTSQAFAYQATVEPQQLESGLFPGVLAPRIREGHDTDIVLQPDRSPRQDGEGLLNYSSTADATDFATSLQGNGAGFQNGASGQLQANVYDPTTLAGSLFDVQAWQDFSDASFLSLLQASLNAQLGLRLSPWELLSADPNGQPRLAYTWPLPGSLAAMRWRPGDGMRIQARDINVWDTTPRQMLVITRNILPDGKASTQANFADRPRTAARTLKQQLFAATRWQRNYQKQLVTLTGTAVVGNIPAGVIGASSVVLPLASDTIIRARLRVAFNGGAANSYNVFVNSVDQTSILNGPWTGVPANIDLAAVATTDSLGQLYAALKNNTGSTVDFSYQLLVDVLR